MRTGPSPLFRDEGIDESCLHYLSHYYHHVRLRKCWSSVNCTLFYFDIGVRMVRILQLLSLLLLLFLFIDFNVYTW